MEKDYSRWTETEAEAIKNTYKERRKVVFLPLWRIWLLHGELLFCWIQG